MTRVQISEEARGLWGDRIHAVVPDAEFVSDAAEVGWLSVDVLRKPDTEFINGLLASDALRWVQSASRATTRGTSRSCCAGACACRPRT